MTKDDQFHDFVAANFQALCRTGFLMCGDRHKAEDAAQEALLRLHTRWHRVDQRLAFARRTMLRLLIDESRRPWRRELPTDDVRASGFTDPTASIVDRNTVLAALDRLSPRQRGCVVLRYYLDLSVRDTAFALNVTEGTVKRATSDALAALRGVLTPELMRN